MCTNISVHLSSYYMAGRQFDWILSNEEILVFGWSCYLFVVSKTTESKEVKLEIFHEWYFPLII